MDVASTLQGTVDASAPGPGYETQPEIQTFPGGGPLQSARLRV